MLDEDPDLSRIIDEVGNDGMGHREERQLLKATRLTDYLKNHFNFLRAKIKRDGLEGLLKYITRKVYNLINYSHRK